MDNSSGVGVLDKAEREIREQIHCLLQGNGTVSFTPGVGVTQTVSDVIADQAGSGGTGRLPGTTRLTWSRILS